MSNQSIGYIRVSTREQSTGRQSDGMEDLKLDRVFTEKASGKSKERPVLRECMAYAREGDTLYIYSMDRLARSLGDLHSIVSELVNKGVIIHFVKENRIYSRDTNDPFNMMLLGILGTFAEFERNVMLERQAEGIAHAKQNGTKSGKPFGKQPLDPNLKPKAITLCDQGFNITEIAKQLGVSRASIYNLLKGHTRTVQY